MLTVNFLSIFSSAVFLSIFFIYSSFKRFSPLALIYTLWRAEEPATYHPAVIMFAINASTYAALILFRINIAEGISCVSLQALQVVCFHGVLTMAGTALYTLCFTGISLGATSATNAILMSVQAGISALATFVCFCRNITPTNNYVKLFESVTSHQNAAKYPRNSHHSLVAPKTLCYEPLTTFLYRRDINSSYLRCAKPYTSMAMSREPGKSYPHILVFNCIKPNNPVNRPILSESQANGTGSRQLDLLGDL